MFWLRHASNSVTEENREDHRKLKEQTIYTSLQQLCVHGPLGCPVEAIGTLYSYTVLLRDSANSRQLRRGYQTPLVSHTRDLSAN